MKLTIKDTKGNKQGELEVKFPLVDNGKGTQAVHDAVVAYQAAQRMGTACTKTMGEVAGTGKKPWRQKGTGRARAGRASSPLWRGGGKVFPNLPEENFAQKLNRRMYRAGVSAILSQLAREDRLSVVDRFTLDTPKTKGLAQKLKGMGLDDVLIVTDSVDDNLRLSSRNLSNVHVVTAGGADPVSLMRHAKVLMTKGAVAKIEEMLA